MDRLLEESFAKIYYEAKLEESKSSLMMAINEFNQLKDDAGKEAARAMKSNGSYKAFIQNFECNFIYILGEIKNDPLLGEGHVRDDFIEGLLKSAADTFKANDIEGTNILGDKLPDSFTPEYYLQNFKRIHEAYVAIGMHATVRTA